MGKVDCVVEALQDSFDKGLYDAARRFLIEGSFSVEKISEILELPLEDVIEIKNNL